jgi:DNA repair protein RadC
VAHGVSSPGLRDLLAVLVGGAQAEATADRLLDAFGCVTELDTAPVEALAAVKGVGAAGAARIKAALALGRRLLEPSEERPTIRSPGDAAQLLQPVLAGREQEYLYVLLLDTRNRVIGPPREIYHGSLNTSLIRIGELFQAAIRANAAAIVVAHNHPSGDPSPSPEDVAVTRSVVEAGKLLDIELLDHLVIGQAGRFVSLKERGLGFG